MQWFLNQISKLVLGNEWHALQKSLLFDVEIWYCTIREEVKAKLAQQAQSDKE